MLEAPTLADVRKQLKLDPRKIGQDAGEQGRPGLDATDDPDERRIVEPIEELLHSARASLRGQLDQANAHFDEISRRDPLGEFDDTVRNAKAGFDKTALAGRQTLQEKQSEATRRQQDLQAFREDNGLSREPHYPDFGRRMLMVGIVAILFVLESFANAAFLAQGNELGLFGAYTVAFGISLANLLPPFLFFGPMSRHFLHAGVGRRVVAGLSTAVYVAIAGTLNLGVAHYREVSGELLGDAGFEVVRRMTQSPMGLQDAESWLLFGIGLIFSLIAFLDGRAFDDPYPGYGKLARTLRDARDELRNAIDDAVQDLDEVRSEARQRIDKIAQWPRERQNLAEKCRRLKEDFERYTAELQELGSTLISEYREANRRARSDDGTPAAHRDPWSLTVAPLDGGVSSTVQETTAQEEMNQKRREAHDQVDSCFEERKSGLLQVTDLRVTQGRPPSAPTGRSN